jgi:hypothetical protein
MQHFLYIRIPVPSRSASAEIDGKAISGRVHSTFRG